MPTLLHTHHKAHHVSPRKWALMVSIAAAVVIIIVLLATILGNAGSAPSSSGPKAHNAAHANKPNQAAGATASSSPKASETSDTSSSSTTPYKLDPVTVKYDQHGCEYALLDGKRFEMGTGDDQMCYAKSTTVKGKDMYNAYDEESYAGNGYSDNYLMPVFTRDFSVPKNVIQVQYTSDAPSDAPDNSPVWRRTTEGSNKVEVLYHDKWISSVAYQAVLEQDTTIARQVRVDLNNKYTAELEAYAPAANWSWTTPN